MKLMTFVGATMLLAVAACDPTAPDVSPASSRAYLGSQIINTFAFDNVAVSLSPVADIDPNGDCAFAEGTANGASTRYLVEDPARMCPKGSAYRTRSLTTLASTVGMNVVSDVTLELNVTWQPTTVRAEQLEISTLSIVHGRPQIAALPIVVPAGTDGPVKRTLVMWRGGETIALTFRVMTACDGTGVNQHGTSTFGVTSAKLVQDGQ